MELTDGKSRYYLKWKDFYFGSDSILVSFRHRDKNALLDEVKEKVSDYKSFVEKYVRDFYTIGGMIIFPQRGFSLNCARGCHQRIRDRWDLTLECIRRYYQGEESPLYKSGSRVKNSLVADGCTIEGSVENCILFPGVTVEKGAELRDSILFKGTRVRDGVTLRYVITDKYVEVLPGRTLMGHESYPIVISKGSIV